MIHRHKWKIIARTYAGPSGEIFDVAFGVEGAPQDAIIKLIKGFTTILWECEECHKLRKEELIGKEGEE